MLTSRLTFSKYVLPLTLCNNITLEGKTNPPGLDLLFSLTHHRSIIIRCPLIRLMRNRWVFGDRTVNRPHAAPGRHTDRTAFSSWAVRGNYLWQTRLYCADVMHRRNTDGYISCFGDIVVLSLCIFHSLHKMYFTHGQGNISLRSNSDIY